VQNTALSPHPCGLPRPSGNVSAMLRPPASAVSATPAPAVIWGCRPGKAQPPPGEIKDTVPDILPGGAALAGPTGCEPVNGSCRPGKAQPPPGNTTGTVPDYCPAALRLHGPKRQPDGSLSLRERARVRESTAGESLMLSVASAHIALPVNCLRYVTHGAGSAQGAASRRRPLYPRAPASNIAAARCLRLIPAGFGSGRGSVRAKHGPQPASMRAAPAFRERLSDVEAATPAVSARLVNKLTTGCANPRSGKRSATRQNNRASADFTSSGALR
ncbi:hypothetical protein AI2693V1_3519, partial [Klebsiella pneumoniae]